MPDEARRWPLEGEVYTFPTEAGPWPFRVTKASRTRTVLVPLTDVEFARVCLGNRDAFYAEACEIFGAAITQAATASLERHTHLRTLVRRLGRRLGRQT